MAPQRNTISDIQIKTAIELYLKGKSQKEIGDILSINRTTVYGIISRYRDTNQLTSVKRGTQGVKKMTEEHDEFITKLIDEDPCISLKEMQQKIEENFEIELSTSTISRHIKDFNYSFKAISKQPIRRNDEKAINDRYIYGQEFIRLLSNYFERDFIFIDEVGFNLSMRTSKGRSRVGTTPFVRIPLIRSRNISMCCAMNSNGIIYFKCQTQAYTKVCFLQFLKEMIEILSNIGQSKHVLIMDNVPFHRNSEIKDLIESKVTILTTI